MIEVLLQLTTVAGVPANVTVLVPWVAPKFVPAIMTPIPTGPSGNERGGVMLGDEPVTVNGEPALETLPADVTTTLPVVAPGGTTATINVSLHEVIVACSPLKNVTVPCVAPKLVPAIVTEAPTAPDGGDRLEIAGVLGGLHVNWDPVDCGPLGRVEVSVA
jgi:hypothetical protein